MLGSRIRSTICFVIWSDILTAIMAVIGVALLGVGRAGNIHFRNLLHNVRVDLKYVVEEDVSIAERLVSAYRLTATQVLHSRDIDLVLGDSSVKACVIATPTQTHEELVMACLTAGKAVFCEKPLANSVEAIAKCYDTAKSQNLPLICSFNRRFDPGLRDIYNRTKSGEVGQLQVVKLTSRDSPLPAFDYLKTSKGIYHDCAVHDLDILAWMFGEKPVSVYTTAHSFIKQIGEMNDVDTLAIVLKFPSGGIGMVDISRFSCFGYDQRFEAFGDKGMLVQHNYKPSNVEFSGVNGASTGRIHHSFPERYKESYINALEHFLDVYEGKCAPDITKESTLLSCDIVEACESSLKSGQAVFLQ